ncbi:MAG: hypothetical protein KME26_23340 [Oscillatoria princeps RMCB-10]|jgi:hypothetical protein|nr:hypothetical protein [Oscillatoria princeps RMCB-10]
MDSTVSDTLVALFLALSHPSISLSKFEKERLFEVGEQLELDPDEWEFISEGLMATITNNPTLDRVFQAELAKLAALPMDMKQQLVPTEKELAQVLSSGNKIEKRGYFDGEADSESRELLNVARKVLKEEDPVAHIQTLSWIDRIKKMLPPRSN